jgi:hypothetical protein
MLTPAAPQLAQEALRWLVWQLWPPGQRALRSTRAHQLASAMQTATLQHSSLGHSIGAVRAVTAHQRMCLVTPPGATRGGRGGGRGGGRSNADRRPQPPGPESPQKRPDSGDSGGGGFERGPARASRSQRQLFGSLEALRSGAVTELEPTAPARRGQQRGPAAKPRGMWVAHECSG